MTGAKHATNDSDSGLAPQASGKHRKKLPRPCLFGKSTSVIIFFVLFSILNMLIYSHQVILYPFYLDTNLYYIINKVIIPRTVVCAYNKRWISKYR